MITFIAAAWLNGKRLDDFKADINRRFEEVNTRFDCVKRRLEMIQASTHAADLRIARFESR